MFGYFDSKSPTHAVMWGQTPSQILNRLKKWYPKRVHHMLGLQSNPPKDEILVYFNCSCVGKIKKV